MASILPKRENVVGMTRIQNSLFAVVCLSTLVFGRLATGETISSMTMPAEESNAIAAVQSGAKVAALEDRAPFSSSAGIQCTYTLYGPLHGKPTVKYPLVLVFDSFGTDAFRLESHQADFPCYVLTIEGESIPSKFPPERRPDWSKARAGLAKELLTRLVKKRNIDPKRLYVTGLASGGKVAWTDAVTYPELFAAVVPCCSACRDLDRAPALVQNHVAVWIFHGVAGNLIRPEQDFGPRAWVAALEKAGGSPRYTEYQLLGQTAMAYCEPELWTWLFAQKKP